MVGRPLSNLLPGALLRFEDGPGQRNGHFLEEVLPIPSFLLDTL